MIPGTTRITSTTPTEVVKINSEWKPSNPYKCLKYHNQTFFIISSFTLSTYTCQKSKH